MGGYVQYKHYKDSLHALRHLASGRERIKGSQFFLRSYTDKGRTTKLIWNVLSDNVVVMINNRNNVFIREGSRYARSAPEKWVRVSDLSAERRRMGGSWRDNILFDYINDQAGSAIDKNIKNENKFLVVRRMPQRLTLDKAVEHLSRIYPRYDYNVEGGRIYATWRQMRKLSDQGLFNEAIRMIKADHRGADISACVAALVGDAGFQQRYTRKMTEAGYDTTVMQSSDWWRGKEYHDNWVEPEVRQEYPSTPEEARRYPSVEGLQERHRRIMEQWAQRGMGSFRAGYVDEVANWTDAELRANPQWRVPTPDDTFPF